MQNPQVTPLPHYHPSHARIQLASHLVESPTNLGQYQIILISSKIPRGPFGKNIVGIWTITTYEISIFPRHTNTSDMSHIVEIFK